MSDEEVAALPFSEREYIESINAFRGLVYAVPAGLASYLVIYFLYLLFR